METHRLSFRCIGLQLNPNAQWKSSLIKDLFSTVTAGVKREKHEKWSIAMAQVSPGPGQSIVDVYRSEIIEDPPIGMVCPTLCAKVECAHRVDYILKIRVLFNSKSWTGGKEMTVCECTVHMSDIVNNGHISTSMTSPYLKGSASLQITLFSAFRPILAHPSLLPRAPSSLRNPLTQSYVFYRDDEWAVPPVVFAEELAVEARISIRVPVVFLANLLAALTRSKIGWLACANQDAQRLRHADNSGPISSEEISMEMQDGPLTSAVSAMREWEWLLGYDARDPFSDVPAVAVSSSSSTVTTPVPLPEFGPSSLRNEVDLLDLNDFEEEGSSDPLPPPGSTNGGGSHDSKEMMACRHSMSFCSDYVARLDEMVDEVREALSNVKELAASGTIFRPSAAKKHLKVQAVPVNLHMQVLAVRDLLKNGQESVLDAITCGCFSPHALGFTEKKGLDAMESSLAAARSKMDECKSKLTRLVAAQSHPQQPQHSSGGRGSDAVGFSLIDTDWSPTPSSSSASFPNNNKRSSTTPSPLDEASLLTSEIRSRAMDYDSHLLVAGRRRIFAVSQALSVAVSSVLMKLSLVLEGSVSAEAAVGWLERGFLLVFEGLLSVIGNERFMLEDTVTAIEALNQFSIRILPLPKSAASGGVSCSSDQHRTEASGFETFSTTTTSTTQQQQADVGMRGREVLLYLPEDALRALPREFACPGGVVLQLVVMLFSQGIDLHQSLALAASSFNAIATQAQANISKSPSKDTLSSLASSGSLSSSINQAGEAVEGAGSAENGGMGSLEESAAMQSLQHGINVRALVRLLDYCQQLNDGDVGAHAAAATAAKDTIDKYRQSLQQPSLRHGTSKPPSSSLSSSSHHHAGRGGTHTHSHSDGIASSSSTLTKAVKASKLALAMTSVASAAIREYGVRLYNKQGEGEGTGTEYLVTGSKTGDAPLSEVLNDLSETILSSGNVISKNVDLLVAVERVCVALAGCRVTFCKSGKDRTGMAVTYEQSRRLGERFHCGTALNRAIRDANVMRVHGVRIDVAEKNIGRRVYSINALQVHFLPVMYRPPAETLETLMRKDDT